LVEVVVIVRGMADNPVGQGQPTPAQVDTSALPLRRRQGLQERQHLGAAAPKRSESFTRVLAEILVFLRPSARIERVADGPADSPGRQIARARP